MKLRIFVAWLSRAEYFRILRLGSGEPRDITLEENMIANAAT